MAPLVHLDGIATSHAGRSIFRDLSWAIGARDRVGFVGPNGSGKSTLLNAIAGGHEIDAGAITRGRNVRIGSLPQDVELEPGSLLEAASVLPARLQEVHDALAGIETQLSDPAVYGDDAKLARTLARQEKALAQYEALGGPQHESNVRATLAQLGFDPSEHALPTHALSGGQKKLVALARLALASPDLLLLDEPDNHLDLAGKQRLERFVRSYPGAVIIVSHDRFLLDETVDAIAELEDGQLALYKGNYSAYAHTRGSSSDCSSRSTTPTSRRRSPGSRRRSRASSCGRAWW